MESELNQFIEAFCPSIGCDFFCFIFIGHGFGRGPGYLYGAGAKEASGTLEVKFYFKKFKQYIGLREWI